MFSSRAQNVTTGQEKRLLQQLREITRVMKEGKLIDGISPEKEAEEAPYMEDWEGKCGFLFLLYCHLNKVVLPELENSPSPPNANRLLQSCLSSFKKGGLQDFTRRIRFPIILMSKWILNYPAFHIAWITQYLLPELADELEYTPVDTLSWLT